ncbi:hypothetical protein LRH25_06640 [Ideonella azotifigens]|uniref:Putative Flp pilus-assembly TadG-like N-terminal domain-containing protein n=1 Tax=Ideonella azotifigens TaxID=513160 RepID=A0ABP3V1F8_9BURK|nr:pilus assembly protein TadG-related protein [Ideonella azotifigens]MCD2340017.1 hypothetical protein [Ideonella azotifigens]
MFNRRLGISPVRRSARGQALIWLLGTMVASAAILYGVFNVAQITVAKQRTVNAADAGALAGATVQARILNLAAYNNRAMIANEAFLIQMLSIESWLQYFGTTANNFGTLADIIGIFIPPIEAIGKILDKLADATEEVHDLLVKADDKAIIPLIEGSKLAIEGAHKAVILAGGALAEDAATKIIDANKTNFGTHTDVGVELDKRPGVLAVTISQNLKDWKNFTTQYTDSKRKDAADVLLASRDRFSTDRPGLWYLNLDLGLMGTEKKGGSKLSSDFNRWETEDTLEVWEKVPCKSGMCKEYQPIGWGRSNADKNGSSGNEWDPHRWAQELAHGDATNHGGNATKLMNWSGVPDVYDIKDKSTNARATLGVDFLVATRKSRAAVLTTHQMGVGLDSTAVTGSGDMLERNEADQYTALAKARVFFERPQRNLANDKTANVLWRSDSAKEYGSLFSPYWQARLVDLTQAEKAKLMIAMGMLPDKVLYTPGGQN